MPSDQKTHVYIGFGMCTQTKLIVITSCSTDKDYAEEVAKQTFPTLVVKVFQEDEYAEGIEKWIMSFGVERESAENAKKSLDNALRFMFQGVKSGVLSIQNGLIMEAAPIDPSLN